MPNLGAGVDQHVNTIATPTWVYNAPAYVAGSLYQPTVRLYNEGTNLLFVGGANVTPLNGFPLPPNSKPMEISNAQFGTVYTCSNSAVGANTAASTVAAALPATIGTTKVTVTTLNAGFVAGTTLQLGSGTNTEFVVVASTSGTVITTANPTFYYHVAGDVMTLATTTVGQLRVTAGV